MFPVAASVSKLRVLFIPASRCVFDFHPNRFAESKSLATWSGRIATGKEAACDLDCCPRKCASRSNCGSVNRDRQCRPQPIGPVIHVHEAKVQPRPRTSSRPASSLKAEAVSFFGRETNLAGIPDGVQTRLRPHQTTRNRWQTPRRHKSPFRRHARTGVRTLFPIVALRPHARFPDGTTSPRSRPSFPAVALTAILAIAATIAVLSTFYKQEASATFIRWGQIISGQRHEQTANSKSGSAPGSWTDSASAAYPSVAAPQLRGPATDSSTGSNAAVDAASIGSAPRGAAPGVEPLQPPSTAAPQVETGEALTPTTSPSQNAPARAPGREATDSAIKSVDRKAKIANDQGGGKTELALAHDYLARASSPKDRDVGMKLLWVAVGDGNTQAELELASLYVRGEDGSGKNCIQARILLRAAYNSGNLVAGQRLAELPDYGCR